MSEPSDFRKQVQHCIDRSEAAPDAEDKAHWLRIAEGWMELAEAFETDKPHAADPTYQISILEKDGSHAGKPANVQAADDAGIIKKAIQLVDGKTVEVKEGARFVAIFPPSE